MFDEIEEKPIKPIDFKYNDGGRAFAEKSTGKTFVGKTGDCVIRAMVIAGNLDYATVYNEIFVRTKHYGDTHNSKVAQNMRRKPSPRTGVFKPIFKSFIEEDMGFIWKPLSKIGSGTMMRINKEELPSSGTYILNTRKHLVAYIDGVLLDTYDSSRRGHGTVYGYWYKPETPLKAKTVVKDKVKAKKVTISLSLARELQAMTKNAKLAKAIAKAV